jgi:hypothetical protein
MVVVSILTQSPRLILNRRGNSPSSLHAFEEEEMRPRILVCGGRDFDNWGLLRDTLYDITDERNWVTEKDIAFNYLPDVVIIHGGAKGADDLADQWAAVNWTGLEIYPADWDKYGKKAGPIRNQQMLDEGKPDLVIAFPTPKSRGTWDMVRRAQKANIETIIVEANGLITKDFI